MVAAGLGAEDRGIELQRHPCQRMPVGSVPCRPRPGKVFPGKASKNMRIKINVNVVVEIDETEALELSENGEDSECQCAGTKDLLLTDVGTS